MVKIEQGEVRMLNNLVVVTVSSISSYSICVPGVHSNCSTIYAGDRLCSYTNEKAVLFSNGYKNDAYMTTLGINVQGSNLEFVTS